MAKEPVGDEMPSSGWLAALTRHFTRAPLLSHPHTQDYGEPDGNGIPTVSSQAFHNGSQPGAPPNIPTTPWRLDKLDAEIQRDKIARPGSTKSAAAVPTANNHRPYHNHLRRNSNGSATYHRSSSAPSRSKRMEGDLGEMSVRGGNGQSGYTSRPQSAASRPSSAASRPTSAASRLSTPAHQLLRSHSQAQTTPVASPGTTLPAQVDGTSLDEAYYDYEMDSRGHYFIPSVIPPLYDRPVAAPTPMSSRCNTPIWDNDMEKRVRFLEPEVVGEIPSRPPSVSSQYSHVLKNSTRFAFQPPQEILGDSLPHNPRHCNCPCHFFPCGRKSVGVQVKRTDPPDPRPRHYRLFFMPTLRGLDEVTLSAKSIGLATRVLLSQVGLLVMVVGWWVAGAAIFSAVEGNAETETVNNMATLRNNLVVDLATELRLVLPHDVLWRATIETYMGKLETAVLDAARAGYASRAPTWTMSGALLYSASLTTLVGPGGMTLRTGFSRLFAVLFSLIGAPLVLLLAISGAFTVREAVGKLWAWRCGLGNQSKVVDGQGITVENRAEQYGSGRGASARSTLNLAAARPQSSASVALGESSRQIPPNGPDLPGSLESAKPTQASGRSEVPQQSRVPVLESSLRASTSSNERSSAGSSTEQSPSSPNVGAGPSTSKPGPSEDLGTQSSTQRRKPGYPFYPLQPPPRKKSKTVPWGVYVAILVAYIILGLAIFAPIQRWSLPSAIYILTGTLLTLDHGSLGEKQYLGSSKIIVPYILYMLLGTILVATVIISVWSNICSSLVSTGKYLTVVRPTGR